MNRRFYFLLSGLLGLFAVSPVIGQITITSTDVSAYLAPGSSTTTKVDTATHTANIGGLGSTSWDFSALVTNFSAVTVNVDPDTTAFFSMFPTATHAINFGAGYSYLQLGVDLQFLGTAQSSPYSIRTKDIPAQIIEKLPLTLGTTWTSTYAESSYVTIGGTTYASVNHHVVVYTVDAYGNLTVPGGSVHPALRVKSDRHVTVGVNTVRQISYQFLAKDGATVSVVPSDTNQAATGAISVSSLSWNLPTVGTSVEEIPGSAVPTAFALGQNYPNPFNPSTTIEFAVPENALVRLSVVNLLGQEVAQLVDQDLAPGRFSVRWDAASAPSGVYFYRLQSGNFTETKRLLLVR